MRADLDGLLNAHQRLDLQTHLRECDACRAESESLASLTARLQNEFHNRWDKQDGPSTNVMANVHSQTRRIMVSKRIDFAFNILGGAATLLILFFVITSVISQFQKKSTVANETRVVADSPRGNDRVLAFTKEVDGNFDIYTMHADGSGLTNITNNPAHDSNPIWSPDGKHIAFESNRNGFMQIYFMDADGSNVIRFTDDKADHSLSLNIDGRSNPWSPDGSKLLFLQSSSGGETGNLYVKGINGENQVLLASGRFSLNNLSWSPDGTYIGYVLNESPTPNETFVTGIYVVDSNGNNAHELKKLVPQNENLGSPYYWSSDGQSIVFIADKNDGPGQTVYEFALETNTLLQKDMLKEGVIDWQDEISLVREVSAFVWQRSDGTSNTLDWGDSNCLLDVTRSLHGNFAIGAYCPDSKKFKLYWANSNGGTIKQLLDSSTLIGQLWDIAWSPEDQYIAFNISLPNKTDMYVLKVAESLSNPSTQPVQVSISGGELYSIPSWQPIPNNDVVEQNPTPEPTQTDNRLLAFTSNKDGNLDIYTMRADGSELTNITNNHAQDVSPVWSPDGKRIAFESDRDGYRQIYIMNIDGSNMIQLTKTEADQWIGEPYNLSLNLWSPDGKRLIFLEMGLGGETGMLYTIDANGENKKPLVKEVGKYSSPSWSPDGKHIAFLVLENSVTRIYSTDADGNNLTNITKMLPSDETLYPVNYSWSGDGKSISFIASNWNYLLGGGGEGSPNYKWMAYEASLDGNTLITNASTRSQIGGYWDGTYFLSGSAAISSSPAFTWVHSDGTITVANPIKNCQNLLDSNTGGYITGYSTYKQSSNGNVVIGAYCPNGDKWLFWANSKGTVRLLLNSPIQVPDVYSNAMELWAPADFIWSHDDRYIAFNIISLGKTEMYIVNVASALEDPSIQPFQITIGNGSLYYTPSWQPIP